MPLLVVCMCLIGFGALQLSRVFVATPVTRFASTPYTPHTPAKRMAKSGRVLGLALIAVLALSLLAPDGMAAAAPLLLWGWRFGSRD